MTEIKYTERENSIRISIHGHSMFKPGNDPVCAGISAITYQILRYISALEDEGMVSDMVIDIESGHCIVTFNLEEGAMDGWRVAWKALSGGFRNFAEQYPENVRFD